MLEFPAASLAALLAPNMGLPEYLTYGILCYVFLQRKV